MDSQSYSLSISYRISSVAHGGVLTFSGMVQYFYKSLEKVEKFLKSCSSHALYGSHTKIKVSAPRLHHLKILP